MLESLLERGIQTKDNFETSFLSDIYTQALTMVESICKANSKNFIGNSEYLTSQKYKEIQNVIAFTGRRGTGKSSAMLTLTNHLCRNETIKCIGSVDNSSLKKFGFYHLTYFSAAAIDENEDVFQIVLSKLFEKLEDFSVKNKYNDTLQIKIDQLKEKICKVYDRYLSLKGSESLDVQSSYNLMDRLSQKYNVREEFKKLISSYTDLLTEISNKKQSVGEGFESFYIIICIDDIDMAPFPMRIMQCINQNLMANNLIVMISYNQKFISSSLTRYFYEIIHFNPNNAESDYLSSKPQSENFLEKIIPSDMIVTMPSWKKKDYQVLSPIKVNIEDTELSKLYVNFPRLKESIILYKYNKTPSLKLEPKHVIMLLVADRTKIYLDVYGNKFHFMEPDSLRNLYDMFYLLYSMDNIVLDEKNKNEKGNHYYGNRISNRKILLDFLNFRLRSKFNFYQEEEDLIDRFLAEPIERRGEIIWNHYYPKLISKKEEIKKLYNDNLNESQNSLFDNGNYSFGGLYRILFISSRLEIMSRNMIKFILASFSFTLPNFVEVEKWKNDERNPDYNGGNGYIGVRELFGYSLLGKWRDDLFKISTDHPTIVYHEKNIYPTVQEPMIALYVNSITKNLTKDTLEMFFKDVIYHFLLSSRSTREPFVVRENISYNSSILYYTVDSKIDPTAFIMNSLWINKRFENMKFIFKNNVYTTTPMPDKTNLSKPYIFSISYLLTELFLICVKKSNEKDEFITSISKLFAGLDNSKNKTRSDKNSLNHKYQKFEVELKNKIESNGELSVYELTRLISTAFKFSEIPTDLFANILHSNKVKVEHCDIVEMITKTLFVMNYYFITALEQIKNAISSSGKQNNSKCDVTFMLKHTDLSYNVIKRSVIKMIYLSSNNIMDRRTITGSYYKIIKKFYKFVVHYLAKEDEVYFIDGEHNLDSFSKHFCAHPVVSYFSGVTDEAFGENSDNTKKVSYCRIEKYDENDNNRKLVDLIALIKQSDYDNLLSPILSYLQVKLPDYMHYSLTQEQSDFIIDKIYQVSYDEKVIEDMYNKGIFASCVNDIRNMLDNGSEEDN